MAMAFSVLQALPSQRRVALSVGRSLSKLKYTTIVRVNKSETLSKIVFVLRCQINGYFKMLLVSLFPFL